MSKVSVAFAKLAGIRRGVGIILEGIVDYFGINDVGRYFHGAENQLRVLREELPDLYEDFVDLAMRPDGGSYRRYQLHLATSTTSLRFARIAHLHRPHNELH